MKISRSQLALIGSLTLHAVLGACIFDLFRSSPLQVQISSIEVITEASAPGAGPTARPVQAVAEKTSTSSSAQAQTLPAAPAAGSEANTTATSSGINAYLGAVRDKLSGAIRLPHGNIATTLRVLLKVTLLENGEVKEPKIEAGSGSADFDRSVLDALDRAKPFPPFTKEMASTHEITLKLPIEIRPRRR
jgi:TonB family protein